MYNYTKKLLTTIETAISNQKQVIDTLISLVETTIQNDRMIHVFGTGHSHMVGIEVFVRAGGLANVNAMMDFDAISISGAIRGSKIERISGIAQIILEEHKTHADDLLFVISNSGRNAMPLEMAIEAKKKGLTIIALTSLAQSKQYPSRHPSGQKLYEICDYVLDNHTPSGDGVIHLEKGLVTGGVSTIIGMTLLQTILTEATVRAHANGYQVPLYTSQNVDGYHNDDLFKKYKERVKFI